MVILLALPGSGSCAAGLSWPAYNGQVLSATAKDSGTTSSGGERDVQGIGGKSGPVGFNRLGDVQGLGCMVCCTVWWIGHNMFVGCFLVLG